MKKYISSLFIILILFYISGCESTINNNEGEYYLYTATSSEGLFENYFNIIDTKTKVFSNEDDFNSFNNLLDDRFSSTSIKFNLNIDFSINDIAVTAIYCDNYNSEITLSSITIENNIVKETFNIENNSYEFGTSTYGFLYYVIKKNANYEFEVTCNTYNNFEPDITIDPERGGGYVVYKPIVYFYPNDEMDLTIKYKYESRLITTYPKYNNGWELYLNSDGTFKTSNSNRTYYALYFDEVATYTVDFSEGFYVTKDNAISFLEEKLDILGYSEREANEFIMYWLPVLESNDKSLVYFETTEIRNNECPLEFSVKPDSMLRVIIHIKKVDDFTTINEQVLPAFNRFGFTVVEWGGINY